MSILNNKNNKKDKSDKKKAPQHGGGSKFISKSSATKGATTVKAHKAGGTRGS